jgi:glycosyltransferase involved in cell wall biosynthesis
MKSTIKWLGKKFESKNIEISNGINMSLYQKADAVERSTLKLNLDVDDKILLMTASFTEQKDQLTLIKAINLLSAKYKLLLLGIGPKQKECISLTEILGITDRVFFLGFQSNVAGLLKMCDVFILSSFCEGMPLSILEAMACSRPVIGSNVNGIRELIWDCGILFEQGNEKDLAQKIEALENIVYYNEVAKKCKKASSKYDILETAKKYVSLYI